MPRCSCKRSVRRLPLEAGVQRVLYCNGQTYMGDATQLDRAIRGCGFYTRSTTKIALRKEGLALPGFVRLNHYIAGVNRFFEAYDALVGHLPELDCRLASSQAFGLTPRAYTGLLVEI